MITTTQEFREAAFMYGVCGLFGIGLAIAVVGGISGGSTLFAVGLAICIAMSLTCIVVRERNLAS